MFKAISSYTNRLNNKVMGLIAGLNVMLLSLLPGKVLAVLPAANAVADGASTTSPIQMFRDFGSRGVTIGATVIAGAIVLGIAYHIYGSFTEAREKDNWKQFGITAASGVVVGAGAVVLSVLAVTYAT
jgi:integrating conjugative element membrane protein (TIGR03745 family)